MYETQKAAAHLDFVQRHVWNSQDCAVLCARDESEAEPCIFQCGKAGTLRLHDYEDDVSGGAPLCLDCLRQLQQEEASRTVPAWVTQNPEQAWIGFLQAEGHGWSALWFLFAPVGCYASPMARIPGEWPVED